MEENFSDFVIFIVNVATFLICMTLAYFIGSNFYHNVIEEESSGEAGSAVAIHDYLMRCQRGFLSVSVSWFSFAADVVTDFGYPFLYIISLLCTPFKIRSFHVFGVVS